MPELPEVESARQLLINHVKGKTIIDVELQEDEILFVSCGAIFEKAVLNKKVTQVGRKGKHMYWILEGAKLHPTFHFGMTGAFKVKDVEWTQYLKTKIDSNSWPPRFWKLWMKFDDGTELCFVNSRRLGRIRLLENPLEEKPIADLGFDALDEVPTLADFSELVLKRKTSLKALLLNQGFSAGVGNWVADEMLYQSKLHPATKASDLAPTELHRLHKAFGIVQQACKVNADYTKFPKDWLFLYRWGKAKDAKDFFGNRIEFQTVGGRTSAFVPKFQKEKIQTATARIASGRPKKDVKVTQSTKKKSSKVKAKSKTGTSKGKKSESKAKTVVKKSLEKKSKKPSGTKANKSSGKKTKKYSGKKKSSVKKTKKSSVKAKRKSAGGARPRRRAVTKKRKSPKSRARKKDMLSKGNISAKSRKRKKPRLFQKVSLSKRKKRTKLARASNIRSKLSKKVSTKAKAKKRKSFEPSLSSQKRKQVSRQVLSG